MPAATLKPNHKGIQAYYAALETYKEHRVKHEGALETAFSRLLADTGRLYHWTLVPKLHQKNGKSIYPDGTLQDDYFLPAVSGRPRTWATTWRRRSARRSRPATRSPTQSLRTPVGRSCTRTARTC